MNLRLKKVINLAITTTVVRNPKINGVYQAYNVDLIINFNNSTQHDVVVVSINKKIILLELKLLLL